MAQVKLTLRTNGLNMNVLADTMSRHYKFIESTDTRLAIQSYDDEADTAVFVLTERLLTIELDDACSFIFMGTLSDRIMYLDGYFNRTSCDQIGMIGDMHYARNYFELAFAGSAYADDEDTRKIEFPVFAKFDYDNHLWWTAAVKDITAFLHKETHCWTHVDYDAYVNITFQFHSTSASLRTKTLGLMFVEGLNMRGVVPDGVIEQLVSLNGVMAREFMEEHFKVL